MNVPDSIAYQTFRTNLSAVLDLRDDISQTSLAKASGLTSPQICNILNGKNEPRLGTIVKISTALGLHWRTLLQDGLDYSVIAGQVTFAAPVEEISA